MSDKKLIGRIAADRIRMQSTLQVTSPQ